MRRVVLLVASGLLLGALLTGGAGALPGSQDLNPLTWLGTVATVAALVVAVGIFRVQQAQDDAAHQELLDAIKAQDEILEELADATPPSEPSSPTRTEALTPAQRQAVEAQIGDRSIAEAWTPPGARGGDNAPRLVRLDDGSLVTVFGGGEEGGGRGGRGSRVRVHQVRPRGQARRR